MFPLSLAISLRQTSLANTSSAIFLSVAATDGRNAAPSTSASSCVLFGDLATRDQADLLSPSFSSRPFPTCFFKFNCPYQLGTHEFSSIPATDAKEYDVGVEKDDVIVLCSDGLVDNLVRSPPFLPSLLPCLSLILLDISPPSSPQSLTIDLILFVDQFDEEMLEEIKAFSGSSSTPRSPQRISEALCSRAKAMSENRKDKGPFGEKAKVSGLNHVGGKRDGEFAFLPVVLGRVDFREISKLTEPLLCSQTFRSS